MAYLRSLAINTLIAEATEIFIENEDEILKGTFSEALLDRSQYKAQIADIIKISVEKIYQSTEVVDKEIAGYGVLSTLLETYINAVNNCFDNSASNYDKLILKGLPKTIKIDQENLYERLLNVCHYISLLSDSQAIIQYKKIKGFSI